MFSEREISLEAHQHFAVPGLVSGEHQVDVIVDRNVSYIDDEGNVRDRIVLARMPRHQIKHFKHGDILEVDGSSYRIGRKEEDDGHIVSFEVHEIGEPG